MSYSEGDILDGRFRLDGRLAVGGMSEVYRGHDVRLDRDVAIKVLRLDAGDHTTEERFATEGRLLAGLTHPHLVRLYDAIGASGSADATAYLVMELVEGGTLAQLLARAPLAEERTRHLAGQLASALAALHSRDIVHRDLKPANVLLEHDGTAKLTDFGIARLAGSAGLTDTGLVVGTAPYLSPEQVRGAEATSASDIYSLGLVLLECLTGHQEYEGTAAEAAVVRLTRSPRVPELHDPALRDLVSAMTDQDPARRPTAVAVVQRATGRAAAFGAEAPGATAPLTAVLPTAVIPAGPAHGRSRWRLLAALGILALLVLVVIGFAVSAHPRPGCEADRSVDGARTHDAHGIDGVEYGARLDPGDTDTTRRRRLTGNLSAGGPGPGRAAEEQRPRQGAQGRERLTRRAGRGPAPRVTPLAGVQHDSISPARGGGLGHG